MFKYVFVVALFMGATAGASQPLNSNQDVHAPDKENECPLKAHGLFTDPSPKAPLQAKNSDGTPRIPGTRAY